MYKRHIPLLQVHTHAHTDTHKHTQTHRDAHTYTHRFHMDNGALAFYFTDKETKAQKGKVLCLSTHKSVRGPEVLVPTPAPLCFSLPGICCALAGMSMKRREKLPTELPGLWNPQ